jgi:hypothetical protein
VIVVMLAIFKIDDDVGNDAFDSCSSNEIEKSSEKYLAVATD